MSSSSPRSFRSSSSFAVIYERSSYETRGLLTFLHGELDKEPDKLDDPVCDCCAFLEGQDLVDHALEECVEGLFIEYTGTGWALLGGVHEELVELDDVLPMRRAICLCLLEYRDDFLLDLLVHRQSRGHCCGFYNTLTTCLLSVA